MISVSNVQAPIETLLDEVDNQKRRQLQAFHPPVERVTAPQVQEAVSPESTVIDFIRQHSASGHLVAHGVFLWSPYSVPEADLSVLLDTLCQDAINVGIIRAQGAEDVYFYSTQAMTTNYANMYVQVAGNGICHAIAEAVRSDGRTYPRSYKVAMLAQPSYNLESQQTAAALTAMETHPDYVDTRTVESSSAESYLFSEHFMSYGRAYGLCEWLEVEQHQNLRILQVDVMECVGDHYHSVRG